MKPRTAILLLLILVLAFAIRLYRLGGQSLWYDEAVTAQVAGRGVAELTRWTADDIQPPLYYYVVAAWTRLAGRTEWALRFPSAFFGTLTLPVLWVLARRLFWGRAGRRAAPAVTLLAGVSSLYVYYAQEARMYTLLVLLGSLAGYLLLRATGWGPGWRAMPGSERRWGWWAGFVAAAAAMLYTHYFGAFLLAAYALVLAFGLLAARRARPAISTGVAARASVALCSVFLLYLPWLPAMLNRYRIDRSYWQGSLKLGETLRHLAVNVTGGAPETMLEADATRLLPWYGLALGLAIAALAWRSGGQPRQAEDGSSRAALGMLVAVLVLPTLAILALVSRTPKFNPRYLMMVTPAYLLLLAGGAGALLARTSGTRGRMVAWAWAGARPLLGAALLGFACLSSLWAVRNWFVDPAFTKSQWREVAGYVRGHIKPGERVLLVSGHAAPAWDYYAADIPRLRLPEIDVLDVSAVLGFESGGLLARALPGHPGAWLVAWQDEAADPLGVIPLLLDRAGDEITANPGAFWHVTLRHWRLRPDAHFAPEPAPAHPQEANFDHKLALLGWDDPQQDEVVIYWRALNTLQADYQVSLRLEDTAGREVWRWDGRPAAYAYPAFRWRPGQATFGRLPLPAGRIPAGDYYLSLAVYDPADPTGLDLRDVADHPAGKRVRIGPLHLP